MHVFKLIAVVALGLGASACTEIEQPSRNIAANGDLVPSTIAAAATSERAAQAVRRGQSPVTVKAIRVEVPRTLSVSEANSYYPSGDIVWREDPLGDRHVSHVGGFALAALAAGAKSALAVDGSTPALALAQQGAQASGVADRFATEQGDAFDVLTALGAEGRQFDLVVCDPPAFAPAKPALEAGLRAYERIARLAAPLVRPGGFLGLCSCSHAADLSRFRTASIRGIGRAGRSGRLIHTGFAGPDHPQHPQLAESGYLKALFFHL